MFDHRKVELTDSYHNIYGVHRIGDAMAKPLIGPDWRLYQIGHLQ
jgi:hypothetical protein